MGFLEVMAAPEKMSSLFDGYSSTFSSDAAELLESLVEEDALAKKMTMTMMRGMMMMIMMRMRKRMRRGKDHDQSFGC